MKEKQSVFRVVFIAVIVALLFSHPSSYAAWQKIGSLGEPVGCVCFLSDNTAFAGSGTYNKNNTLKIWYTNDGGVSWSTASVPNGVGQVTQISIRADGQGYASIFSQPNPGMNLWKTTDGGFTWSDVSTGAKFGSGAGISTMLQGFASWTIGLPANGSTNGVFFMDPSTMLITPGPGSTPIGEAWSAWGDPKTRIWYAITELSKRLVMSTDLGVTWNSRFDFGSKLITGVKSPTGHIVGGGGVMYIQSDTGIFRGTLADSGLTWYSIGGPNNFQDTRTLYVGGCSGELIVAFDQTGGVWKSTDGGNGGLGGAKPLTFTHPKFQNISACKNDLRKLFFTNLYCYDYVVTKISFDVNTSGAFSLQLPTLPDTLRSSVTDSFTVLFNPAQNPGTYTAQIRIKGFHITAGGNKTIDSVVTLTAIANAEGPEFFVTPTKIDFDTLSICGKSKDTVFTMRNDGCDTLYVTSGPGTIGAEFTIDPLSLPFAIPPDSMISLRCSFKATTPGVKQEFPSYTATQQGLKKTVGMILDAYGEDGAGILDHAPKSFAFDTVSFCSLSSDSSSGFLTNTGCIPLTVENFALTGNADFTLLGADPTGTSIKPGDTLRFKFKFSPLQKGSRAASIALRTKNTSGTGVSKDYSISITGFVGIGTKILSQSLTSIDFGTTTLCEERDSVISFTNKGCDTLILTAADLKGAGFTMTGVTPPIILIPGASTQIKIQTIVDTTGGKTTTSGTLSVTSTADNVLSPITLKRSVTVPSKKNVAFGIISKPNAPGKIGTAGDVVSFALKESATLPFAGSGVKQLEFDLVYNTDLLEYIDKAQGANTLTTSDGKHFILSGNPITAGANGELVEFFFEVFLTKDSTTALHITNITIPGITQGPCTSSVDASATDTSFRYTYLCADHILQDFMRTNLISIQSIVPNPTHNEMSVEIHSPNATVSLVEIFDALGHQVMQRSLSLQSGKNVVDLKTMGLAEGSYIIRIGTDAGAVSRRFVKVK